jgi:hypothetical protein
MPVDRRRPVTEARADPAAHGTCRRIEKCIALFLDGKQR